METIDVSKFRVSSLSFEFHEAKTWGPAAEQKPAHWSAKARLHKTGQRYEGINDIDIVVNDEIATEIMKIMVPIMVQQAALAAEKLASEAKELAKQVGECCLLSLNDKKKDEL